MFAAAGFGQEFPILVYAYERDQTEIEQMFFKFGKLTSQTERLDLNDPQNQEKLIYEAENVSLDLFEPNLISKIEK